MKHTYIKQVLEILENGRDELEDIAARIVAADPSLDGADIEGIAYLLAGDIAAKELASPGKKPRVYLFPSVPPQMPEYPADECPY